MRYSLLDDISINSKLKVCTNTEFVYDLSLSFKYDKSAANNQNIICEAIQKIVFGLPRPKNYIKFVLDASNYLGEPLNRSYITVAHEPINSKSIVRETRLSNFISVHAFSISLLQCISSKIKIVCSSDLVKSKLKYCIVGLYR